MGAVQEFRKGPLFAFEGLTAPRFADGNRPSTNRAIAEYRAGMDSLIAGLDHLRPLGTELIREGRAPSYALGHLFMPHALKLLLNKKFTQAYRTIQSDPELRELLGYEPLSNETHARLAEATAANPVTEPSFPRRQLADNFVQRWLPEHTPDLGWLRYFAYVELPYRIKVLAPDYADYTAVAIDGTRVAAIRADSEAAWVKKGQEDAIWGRRLHTVIAAKGAPVVLYGEINTTAELTHARFCVDQVIAHCEAMAKQAELDGIEFDLWRPGLWVGDALFRDTELMRVLYERDCLGLFRTTGWPSRTIHESFTAEGATPDGAPFSVEYDVTTDGAIFCPCDRHLDINERNPMHQFVGRSGPAGHVYVACDNLCTRRGVRIYVPFKQFTTVDGNPNLALVTPVDPASKLNLAILRKGTQNIEHSHSQLAAQFGLAMPDTRGRRIITGNFAHRFEYTLGHALWNLTILLNLQAGRPTFTQLTPEELFEAEVRSTRSIVVKNHRKKVAKALHEGRTIDQEPERVRVAEYR